MSKINEKLTTEIKLEKLKTFNVEDYTKSKNKKLVAVGELLNNEAFLERIKSYSETYWDQKWSQTW